MRKLKALPTGFKITKYDILLCCQIFFWDVNRTIRSTIPEYQEQQFAYENGVIQCPECLYKTLQTKGDSN